MGERGQRMEGHGKSCQQPPKSWERIWTHVPSEPAQGTDLVSTLVTEF